MRRTGQCSADVPSLPGVVGNDEVGSVGEKPKGPHNRMEATGEGKTR